MPKPTDRNTVNIRRARYVGLSALKRAPIVIFDDTQDPRGGEGSFLVTIEATPHGMVVTERQAGVSFDPLPHDVK